MVKMKPRNKRPAWGYLIGGLVAAALLLEAPCPAQSLGEVARQQRAKKGPQARPTRVYTDDNLPRTSGLSATAEAKGRGLTGEKKLGERLAPFVPSPETVVEQMLKLAQVQPSDTVYDLGCGDGRILIMAAQKFGAKAVGVEIDEDLYKRTSARVKELKLEDQVTVVHGDMLEVDLTPATVVTLYLLYSANEKLRPNMEKYLKPGARVVSHDFEVPGWKPDRVVNFAEDETRQHTLYLYLR